MREQDRFRWTPVECIDFNRHGMAIAAARPLAEGSRLTVALEALDVRLEAINAVVHNCRRLHGAWRCGVQFRPAAAQTGDALSATEALIRLEQRLQNVDESCSRSPTE